MDNLFLPSTETTQDTSDGDNESLRSRKRKDGAILNPLYTDKDDEKKRGHRLLPPQLARSCLCDAHDVHRNTATDSSPSR